MIAPSFSIEQEYTEGWYFDIDELRDIPVNALIRSRYYIDGNEVSKQEFEEQWEVWSRKCG